MTLAWARLDFDFETNEVLVEEVQSDLVRDIGQMKKYAWAAKTRKKDHFYFWGTRIQVREFDQFADAFLFAFKSTWQEAMLAATVSFAFDELGVKHLYYHTFKSGSVLKNIGNTQPPRSLYSELPEKFCFNETQSAPEFLKKDKRARRKLKKIKDCRWFYMAA